MNELNKDLRNQAVALGLCNDWQNLLNKDWSNEKMAERMFKGLDFCLKHHFPSNEYLSKHFEKDFLRKCNVFVNDKYSVLDPQNCLALGTSEIIVRYNGNSHGIIHFRDNSNVKIIAKGRSFVIVHLFEKSYVMAEQKDMAKIVLVKHSPDVTIVADNNIKVNEEYDYLK